MVASLFNCIFAAKYNTLVLLWTQITGNAAPSGRRASFIQVGRRKGNRNDKSY